MMLVDTDVLIWYMRGNDKARRAIESLSGLSISVITYMELVQGMKSKSEVAILRQVLRDWDAKIIYISEEIATKAMFYVEQQFLSRSLKLAEAFIGASAIAGGLTILTGNDENYRVLKDLKIRKFQP